MRGGAEAHGTRLKRWPYDRGEAGNMARGLVDISPKKTELVRVFKSGSDMRGSMFLKDFSYGHVEAGWAHERLSRGDMMAPN